MAAQSEAAQPVARALDGKVVVVTGAAGGLGAAIAAACERDGAAVTTVDVADLPVRPRELHLSLDLSDPANATEVVRRVVERHGRLDVLYNNAGVAGRAPTYLEVTPEEWDRVLGVNLRGAFFMAQAACRVMVEQGHGVVINTTSQLAAIAQRGHVHYVAAKGALLQITRGLAVELAPHGVRVIALAPGITRTPFIDQRMDDPEWLKNRLDRIPMGRFGEPDEIAETAVFLASDRASYITGASIYVDGGYTAW